MVDIAKIPLTKRIKTVSDNLFACAAQSSPGQIILTAEVYDDLLDILQELIDLRKAQSEDLDSAYERIGEEISDFSELGEKLNESVRTNSLLAAKLLEVQDELRDALAKIEKA